MKTFNDLDFQFMQYGSGIKARINFDNEYGASVIRSPDSYGGDQDLYELAVTKNNVICYDSPITDDVLGYLNKDQVSDYLRQIQELKN